MRSRSVLCVVLSALGIASCNEPPRRDQAVRTNVAAVDTTALGQRIWRNECAGTKQGLVSWNAGEAFPSLGIGHFIWYPAGYRGPFDESFPQFVAYAQRRGVRVPAYFVGKAPWSSKSAFLADQSGLADRMRDWLAAHLTLQTEFIMARSRASLSKMLRQSSRPEQVRAHYNALARTTQGVYCLVDYVNFKGEGIKSTERYRGQGWGLLQVLEEMRGNPQGRAATAEFARAAAAVLTRRVENAPAERGERRWLPGWLNRCSTYR